MKLTPKGCQTSPGFEPNGDRGALTDSDPNAYLDVHRPDGDAERHSDG